MDVAFGVIGTAGIALHSARRVYELVSGIRGAPEAVNNVSRDVNALSNALEMLQTMLRAFHEPEQLKMVPMLQAPLDNCIEILHDIEIKIKPYIKTQPGKPNVWRGFVWAFREKDILTLQNTLLAYKQSLDIAISIADYSNNISSSSDNRENFYAVRRSIRKLNRKLDADRDSVANDTYAGSDSGSSDYAYNVKQWLLSAETAFEEVATDDPAETQTLKLESDEDLDIKERDLDIEERNLDKTETNEATRTAGNDEQSQVDRQVEPRKAVTVPYEDTSTQDDSLTASPTIPDPFTSRTAEGSAKNQPEPSVEPVRPLIRSLSRVLESEAEFFESFKTQVTVPRPVGLQSSEEADSIVRAVAEATEPPATNIVEENNIPSPGTGPSSSLKATTDESIQGNLDGSTGTADDTDGYFNGKPIAPMMKTSTHILIATKELLESLTSWSRRQVSEEEVSNKYVRLGNEINDACRIFASMDLDTSDLRPVPDLLRDILEQILSQEPSQAILVRYLPSLRDVVMNLLNGLKRQQALVRKGATPSTTIDLAMNAVDEAETTPTWPKNPLFPKRHDIVTKEVVDNEVRVGDIVVAIHAFQKRSTDEVGFPKYAAIKVTELDTDFGDGWYEGKVIATEEVGLFPKVYTKKLSPSENAALLHQNERSAKKELITSLT